MGETQEPDDRDQVRGVTRAFPAPKPGRSPSRRGMRAAAQSTGTFLVTAAMLTGCGSAPARPGQEEIITAATVKLTDSCLRHQGLTAPRPGQAVPAAQRQRVTDALFGTGPAQLSLTLPTGYVVRAHTDGCLAAAQRRLYGDQAAWFRTSVVVDNLQPEADYTHRSLTQVRARHRAELAEWQRLRARALSEATALLSNSDTPGRSS